MNKLAKALLAFCFSLSLFAILPSLALAQPIVPSAGGQKMCVLPLGATSTDCSSDPIVSTGNTFTFSFMDAPTQTVTNTPSGSWYHAFWITGDGNYLKIGDHKTSFQQDQIIARLTYTYPQGGEYKPVVYFTEKYNNSEPPDVLSRTIRAGGGITPEVRDLMPQLRDSRKIALDYNHPPRPNHPIVLAVSFSKDISMFKGVLLLYNGFNMEGGTVAKSSSLVNYIKTDLPNYFNGNNSPFAEKSITNLSNDFPGTFLPTSLSSQYSNYVWFNLNAPISSVIPNAFKELRIFPQLKTAALSRFPSGIPIEPLSFTAILIAQKPLDDNDPYYGRLQGEVNEIFDTTDLSLGNSGYIVGTAQLNLPIAASHDPNQLMITGIQDAGQGKFRVRFKLKICNEGEILEPNPKVNVEDLTGGLFQNLKLIDRTDMVMPSPNNWAFQLLNFPIAPVPKPYEPKCEEVEFTMETNATGIQKLSIGDPRVLKACVVFTSGIVGNLTCCLNDTMPLGEFRNATDKYEPMEEKCDCWLFCGYYWLVLVVLLLLLLYILAKWYKKSNGNTPN